MESFPDHKCVSPKAAATAIVIWAGVALAMNTDALPDWARSVNLPDRAQLALVHAADAIDTKARSIGFAAPKEWIREAMQRLGAPTDDFETGF